MLMQKKSVKLMQESETILTDSELFKILLQVKNGNFSVRLPADQVGIKGKICETLNEIIDLNKRMVFQLEKVGKSIGKQGKLTNRVELDGARGSYELLLQGEHLKALNKKLKQNADHLIRINEELESFSYSVSHDLRAPLRAITGFSRMLMDDYNATLDDNGKRILSVIGMNAEKMGKLIDDLLTFSRLGRKELTKENLDMNNLVESVLSDIDKKIINHAQIVINPLPAALSDHVLMRQVMANLVSNAIKYSSKEEKPFVEIGAIQNKEDGPVYYVKDNGVGFDMKYYNKLFGVFQRLHSSEEFEGTGIGLAIVHRIISKHGGRVWCEGKVNEGATFYFTVPG